MEVNIVLSHDFESDKIRQNRSRAQGDQQVSHSQRYHPYNHNAIQPVVPSGESVRLAAIACRWISWPIKHLSWKKKSKYVSEIANECVSA